MSNYIDQVTERGELPAFTFPGMYPIIYIAHNGTILCPKCATKSPEEIADHSAHMEGEPIVCDACNAIIESAYGVPEE